MSPQAKEPNYQSAEAKSFAVLQRFGIDAPNFDVRDIAYGLGVDVIDGGVSTGDARIFRNDSGRGIIRLNKAIHELVRQRFSIAHELGHWEMHPDLPQGYLCTAADLRDYGRSPMEAEANWFAATLLMPKFLIPVEVFKQDPGFTFITKLAKDFGTSLTAATRRFVELSNQPLVLIASSNGRIDWIARSKSAKAAYYFVHPGTDLPMHSLTNEVASAKVKACRADNIEPRIWFQDREFDRNAELFEEVMYSPVHDGALTLLWIPG